MGFDRPFPRFGLIIELVSLLDINIDSTHGCVTRVWRRFASSKPVEKCFGEFGPLKKSDVGENES